MKYDTVIFDLDGTLLNTLADLTDSVNFALNSFGYSFRTIDEVHDFVGNGIRQLIVLSLPEQHRDEQTVDKALELFKQYYSQNMTTKTRPYDGIIDLLKTLKNKNIKMGIASNKVDFGVQMLNKHFFDGLDILAVGESETMPRKPSPNMVKYIIETLHSENVLYVGDSSTDCKTALNSNVDQISVLWGYQSKQQLLDAGATYFISNPCEILSIVEEGK